jgi:hypothetical protein
LLLTIVRPHSGQFRIGGRDRADILPATFRQPGYLPGVRVCMSAQHKVTANTPKAAAMIVATMISVGIDVLPFLQEHDAGKIT